MAELTSVAVIVPTRNESANIAELVVRLDRVLSAPELSHLRSEVLFADDSTDDTPDRVRCAAATARISVRCLHRDEPKGGLGGAVLAGMRATESDAVVVIDGDLQHPPEIIGELLAGLSDTEADLVLGSRYLAGGAATGLDGGWRRRVSLRSAALARRMFPRELAGCTDPLTGCFAVRRGSVDLALLRPQGFKILLEMIVQLRLRWTEVPLRFAPRRDELSKASLRQGVVFLGQLLRLRWQVRARRRRAVLVTATEAGR